MKKALLVAAIAAMVPGVAFAQATVEFSTAKPDGSTFQIYAEIVSGTTEGLALVGVDVASDVAGGLAGLTAIQPAPLTSFERNEGLTNPGSGPNGSGYFGTEIGDVLKQVGGGQNTIGYAGTDPSYPTGAVVFGLGNSGPVLVAAYAVSVSEPTTYTIQDAFANTIDSMTGPPYPVSMATVQYLNASQDYGAVTPQLIEAYSSATHGAAGVQELAIGIGPGGMGLVEPRSGVVDIRLKYDAAIAPASESVTVVPDPGVTASLAAGAAADELMLTFSATPPTGEYTVTLNGGEFRYCVALGDVNCSGDTTGLDLSVVTGPLNWLKTVGPPDNADPRADVNRSGDVTGLDLSVITGPLAWLQPSPALTCGCP